MIVKTSMVILLLSITLLNIASGTSYSQVYVESELAVPVEYYQYGAPYTQLVNPQMPRLTSLPAVNRYPPCGSPCIVSGQTLAPVAPLNPNANVITYNPPIPNTLPVVITPNKEGKSGYEYSYVVYDDDTGDHKAQREHSDGEVVRGEYSFLQPDGYVREVQYVADDVQGFNAIVKNFLPVPSESHRKVGHKAKESSPHCKEAKHEQLKAISKEESEESLEIIEVKHKKEPKKESKESGEKHQSHKPKKESKQSGESKKSNESKENSKEESKEENGSNKSSEESEEKSNESSTEDSKEKPKKGSKASGEKSKENSKESKEKSKEKSKESKEKSKESKENSKESKENSKESKQNSKESNESSKDSKEDSKESEENSKESKENSKEKPKKNSKETKKSSEEKHKGKSNESSKSNESEESGEEVEHSIEKPKKKSESHEKIKEKHKKKPNKESKESESESEEERIENIPYSQLKDAHELITPEQEYLVPYHDIIRCIQAAINKSGKPSPMIESPSPLTYIILNKPC